MVAKRKRGSAEQHTEDIGRPTAGAAAWRFTKACEADPNGPPSPRYASIPRLMLTTHDHGDDDAARSSRQSPSRSNAARMPLVVSRWSQRRHRPAQFRRGEGRGASKLGGRQPAGPRCMCRAGSSITEWARRSVGEAIGSADRWLSRRRRCCALSACGRRSVNSSRDREATEGAARL